MFSKIKNNRFIGIFGIVWSYLILFIAAFLLQAFVFAFLWNSFVVPLGFHNITILHAMGLIIFLDFITYDYRKNEDEAVAAFKYIFVRPAIAFIFGLAIHILKW
jgi:hypothetical protein